MNPAAGSALFQRIDLHTHSHHSDGALSPTALVALAVEREVELLALTDHDTTAGCAEAAAACADAAGKCGPRFLPGVELTAGWRQLEIHVVGLGIDAGAPALAGFCASTRAARVARADGIRERLLHEGVDESALTAALMAPLTAALADDRPPADAVVTRTHFARALVRLGRAGSVQDAFDRWLGRGKPAYVAPAWQALGQAVRAIVAAGGLAVLAHPHRYKLSNGQLGVLCAEFAGLGGAGLEVSLAGISPGDADRLRRHARKLGLAGSVASDFHEPGLPWRPLGRFAKLPDGIEPIVDRLRLDD